MTFDVLAPLHAHDRDLLNRFGFDEQAWGANRSRLLSGTNPDRLDGLSLLDAADVCAVDSLSEDEIAQATGIGHGALRAGRLAHLVLAGGMATRFGGGVKGLVELVPGRTFLDWHLQRISGLGPLVLMTSFATHDALLQWASERGETKTFCQGLAPRLRTDGTLYRDQEGKLSFAATGHGDLPQHLISSGTYQALRDTGVEVLLVTNVDNVAAGPDPLLLGLHLLGGTRISVELAPRARGDRGGLPLRHRGRPRIVEDYLIPPSFDIQGVDLLNTNTLWISLDALAQAPPMTWVAARKQVAGQDVVQFERLVGELTAFHSTRFLHVPRGGPRGRFQPVKSQADLRPATQWMQEHDMVPPECP